jgi:hypothetical protein
MEYGGLFPECSFWADDKYRGFRNVKETWIYFCSIGFYDRFFARDLISATAQFETYSPPDITGNLGIRQPFGILKFNCVRFGGVRVDC